MGINEIWLSERRERLLEVADEAKVTTGAGVEERRSATAPAEVETAQAAERA